MEPQFFSTSFLRSLPTDVDEASLAIADEFFRFHETAKADSRSHYEEYIGTLLLLRAYCDSRGVNANLALGLEDSGSSESSQINAVIGTYDDLRNRTRATINARSRAERFESKRTHYAEIFQGSSMYEFSDDDYDRVQRLVSELRELLQKSKLIGDDHRRRLLRRLEAMQAELHKKTSDIDRFWGFVGEAGIAIRKFGEDMKPISERVQELANLVIRVIMLKEGITALPDINKLVQITDEDHKS